MSGSATFPWTLFIFCYNEKDSVGNTIDRTVSVSLELAQTPCEVLVIDDGSTDGSSEVIEQKCAQYETVRAIHHPLNRGIGAALISGYTQAKGMRICGIPADGQFNPEELLPYKNFESGEVISFVRQDKRYNFYRAILSSFNNLTNRIFLGMSVGDVNWVKAYHADDLKQINPTLKSSLIESEMCALLKVRGTRFREVDSIYHQRRAGKTKGGSLKTVGLAALDFSRLVWRVNLFRIRNC